MVGITFMVVITFMGDTTVFLWSLRPSNESSRGTKHHRVNLGQRFMASHWLGDSSRRTGDRDRRSQRSRGPAKSALIMLSV